MASPGAAMASPFDVHSPEARAIADLFTETLLVCAVILLIVTGLVVWCAVRFRARGAGEPPETHRDKRLEIAWTVGPRLVLVGLFVLTSKTVGATDPSSNRPPDLTVIAHQWWWEVRYRSGASTANEIHIPVKRDLLVEIRSADVIHDFWVPQLARKIDATPGHPTHVWMQADAPGTYLGACAEYCGTQHAWMRISVVAQSPDEFAAWEKGVLPPSPAPSTEAATRGARLFQAKTCVRCHDLRLSVGFNPPLTPLSSPIEGPRAGPDLTHLAGRETLGAGVLVNDKDGLTRWLKDPQAIKPGSHMPGFQLTDDEVADFVAYFET